MSDALQKIRQFIAAGHERPVQFSDTDDLLEDGLVDSLRFVEFVMLIAELSNRQIALDTLDIEEFRTVQTIRQTYFPHLAEAAGATQAAAVQEAS